MATKNPTTIIRTTRREVVRFVETVSEVFAEPFPSAPFPAARKIIVVEGETLSDELPPTRRPGLRSCAPVAFRKVASR